MSAASGRAAKSYLGAYSEEGRERDVICNAYGSWRSSAQGGLECRHIYRQLHSRSYHSIKKFNCKVKIFVSREIAAFDSRNRHIDRPRPLYIGPLGHLHSQLLGGISGH